MGAPIFIVGANRSGTTLLRLILNAHSRIAVPEEVLYLRSEIAGQRIEDWQQEIATSSFEKLVTDFVSRVEIPDLDKESAIASILNLRPNLRSPYSGLMDFWTRQQGKVRWGEKTPGNLFYADIIDQMFPGSLFIHMVRDPRAVVHSMEQVWFFPEDVTFNALSWHKHLTAGRTTLEESIPADRILTLRYEDLVAEPYPVVRKVFSFIGEEFEDDVMAYHRGAGKHMRSDAAANFNELATKPITSTANDKWKKGLSRRDVEIIESICADQMQEFLYEPVTDGGGAIAKSVVAVKRRYWDRQLEKNAANRHFTVRYKMSAGILRRLGYRPPRRKPEGVY